MTNLRLPPVGGAAKYAAVGVVGGRPKRRSGENKRRISDSQENVRDLLYPAGKT